MSLRILLADDHQIFRDGLKALIDQQTHLNVVAEASTGRSAITLASQVLPDIVIMDITMPDLNGIDATRRIVKDNPDIKVIGLSMHKDRGFVEEMFQAGALGYLHKQCPFEQLLEAIDHVNAGRPFLCRDFENFNLDDLVLHRNHPDSSVRSKLTQREREILQLLAECHTTKQIAASRNISVKTVEAHRQNIMRKLKIDNIAGLTKYALRNGITSLDV